MAIPDRSFETPPVEVQALEARRLVRGAPAATLATQTGGQPFVALVTPAPAPDLSLLLWLSSISEHTRELRAEPRCALMFQGLPETPNPQTTPRVTLTGLAEPVPEAEAGPLKARWLARHPYAALYADFPDFALWRVRPVAALLVAGFARATRLRAADFLPDAAAVAAIAEAEAGIIAGINQDHRDSLTIIAEGLLGQPPGSWRLAAVDVDGCDLALGERIARLPFAAPVAAPAEVGPALARAAREAHGRSGGGAGRHVAPS